MLNDKKIKHVIGWREYISLPEWGIKNLKAKIDTGAKSCSLHVEDIKELDDNSISFYVVLDRKGKRKKVVAHVERKGHVKSSVGTKTSRWFVSTEIQIGEVVKTVKLSLINREYMNFRMLIGRTAIHDDFMVDVAHGYMLKKKKPGRQSTNKKKSR